MRWRPEGHAGHLRIARVRWFSLAAPEPDNTARREIARQEHPIRSMGNTPVEKHGGLQGCLKRIVELKDRLRSARPGTAIDGFTTWRSSRLHGGGS